MVGTKRVKVILTVGTRTQIDVVVAPRILRDTVKIAAFFPIRTRLEVARLGHERLKSLVGGREFQIIKFVQT